LKRALQSAVRAHAEGHLVDDEGNDREFWIALFNLPTVDSLRSLRSAQLGRLVAFQARGPRPGAQRGRRRGRWPSPDLGNRLPAEEGPVQSDARRIWLYTPPAFPDRPARVPPASAAHRSAPPRAQPTGVRARRSSPSCRPAQRLWAQSGRRAAFASAGARARGATRPRATRAPAQGTVTRTSEVRPELFLGTFRCLDCGTTARNIEQQFKFTQPLICKGVGCGNRRGGPSPCRRRSARYTREHGGRVLSLPPFRRALALFQACMSRMGLLAGTVTTFAAALSARRPAAGAESRARGRRRAWSLVKEESTFVDWQRVKVQENSDEVRACTATPTPDRAAGLQHTAEGLMSTSRCSGWC